MHEWYMNRNDGLREKQTMPISLEHVEFIRADRKFIPSCFTQYLLLVLLQLRVYSTVNTRIHMLPITPYGFSDLKPQIQRREL